MKLVVQVDPRRDHEGTLTLQDAAGEVVFGPVPVCATADEATARRLGNATRDPLRPGGHPPCGSYRLVEVATLGPAEHGARGPYALTFEPRTGEALNAESRGRLLLELHGGAPGGDGALRATSGGLRVSDDALVELAARLGRVPACELQVQAVKEGWWSRLFRRRRPLSDDEPAEESFSSRSPSDSSASESMLSGRGGDFSGGGASGSWDAPSPAQAVAASGAAVAAGAAIVTGAALAAGDSTPASGTGDADNAPAGSGSAADPESDVAASEGATADSESAASDSESGTTASTGY